MKKKLLSENIPCIGMDRSEQTLQMQVRLLQRGGGGGARISEIFSQRIQISRISEIFSQRIQISKSKKKKKIRQNLGEPGLVDRVLALHAGSRGFDSHQGHMSERFF